MEKVPTHKSAKAVRHYRTFLFSYISKKEQTS